MYLIRSVPEANFGYNKRKNKQTHTIILPNNHHIGFIASLHRYFTLFLLC